MTDAEFFHWFILVSDISFRFILSNICLLILPISDFEGFINLHDILLGKSFLWSLMVIYASCLILLTFDLDYFLYVFVIFSVKSLSLSSFSDYKCCPICQLEQISYYYFWCYLNYFFNCVWNRLFALFKDIFFMINSMSFSKFVNSLTTGGQFLDRNPYFSALSFYNFPRKASALHSIHFNNNSVFDIRCIS